MDPFKYREIRGYFTARTPDTADSDLNPDQVPLNGTATLLPQFQGGSIVFTEIGEFAIPQPLQARIVDGHLMVETNVGEDMILQPLHLPVTVDERANQKWSWRIRFDSLTIGEYGDEVRHPELSFPVEDGAVPLNLSTVATAVKQSGSFITRGVPGAGLQDITAENGEITFAWDDGKSTVIAVPDAVPGEEGRTPDITFSGTNIVVDGTTGPDLKGEKGDPGQSQLTGDVSASSDLGALEPGFYRVTNATTATALGLPLARPGIIENMNVLATGARTQRFQALGAAGVGTRVFYRDQISNTWSPWREVQLDLTYQGVLPANSDLNTVRKDGVYGAASGVTTNRPVALNGIVEVLSVGTGVMQRYTTVNAVPEVWMRRGQADGSSWLAWVRIDAGGVKVDSAGAVGHGLIAQGISARKGGRIGTGGRGVVALRFDDAPAEFVAKVLPLLEARGLPFTRVTTSESINGTALPSDTFSVMQDYSIRAGGEVWNHGRTHGEATVANLETEISGALATLKTAMPKLPIDCFAPPGGSITWGGYMPSNAAENYTTTTAGQMIMRLHGLVTGYYQDSYYWPLDGTMRDGQNHYSCDSYNASTCKTLVDRARDWRVGVVLMWHAHNIDTGGAATTAVLTEVLDYIAAQREAGNIMCLTVSGLATADASSEYRRDPLSTHAGASWSESFTYPQFRREITGSTRELTATVTGTAGATVTSKIGDSTKTHTIPAGGTLNLRHPATIPKDATSLVVSISGGTTANAHLYAV